MQDLSVRMSAAGSCRTTCARSLHQCIRISAGPLVEDSLPDYANATLPAFRAMDARDLGRGWRFEIRNRNFTSISRDGHARSPQRVALGNQKSQLYQHFARWTRTISAEGCASKSEIATLPAFRALDTHDLCRGLHLETKKHNFTCIPRTRHARSRQRVAV